MTDLHCCVCSKQYANKQAYNDHLHRRSHKNAYLVRMSFYDEIKNRMPDKYEKEYSEHVKACEESNKPK